jgi:transcriptional regulator with XRE-family HTH domain
MTPSPSQVGQAIRRLRRKKGVSQADLAARAGLSREYVNKIEAGKYDPPLSTLTALAKALRVRAARLLE